MAYPRPPQYGGGPYRRRPRRNPHLVLTFITCGAWGLFVWAPLTLWRRFGRHPLILVGYYTALVLLLVINAAVNSPPRTPAKRTTGRRPATASVGTSPSPLLATTPAAAALPPAGPPPPTKRAAAGPDWGDGAQPDTTEPAGPDEPFYPNCAAARAAGVAPIYRGQPGYRPELDRDRDGIACE